MKSLSSFTFAKVPSSVKNNQSFKEIREQDSSDRFRKIVLMFKEGKPVDLAIKEYGLIRENLPSYKVSEYDECINALVSMTKLNLKGRF